MGRTQNFTKNLCFGDFLGHKIFIGGKLLQQNINLETNCKPLGPLTPYWVEIFDPKSGRNAENLDYGES